MRPFYRDSLLAVGVGTASVLPGFLTGRTRENRPAPEDIRAGFTLTDYFLRQYVYEPRGQAPPEERARFVALATVADDRDRF